MFLVDARPMKDEWNMRPYFGVFPRVLRALKWNQEINHNISEAYRTMFVYLTNQQILNI